MHIPGAVGVIFWCGIILPATYVVASSISQAIFTDALVLSGACPNCGEVNTTYFGDILTGEPEGLERGSGVGCERNRLQLGRASQSMLRPPRRPSRAHPPLLLRRPSCPCLLPRCSGGPPREERGQVPLLRVQADF